MRDQQFSGCLVGQCLGDALGFVVEGCSPAVCRKYVSETLYAGQAAAEGTCGRLQGRWDLVTGSAEGTQELV